MKIKSLGILPFLFLLAFVNIVYANEAPHIEIFSPQGIVKGIRQVSVRFSEQMVPFGDPRGFIEPFDIDCNEKGAGRWADGKNWIYDFERDLPAGVRCEFNVKSEIKTLSGKVITGQKKFIFSTGGPAIKLLFPYQGSHIDEEQIFIIELDAEPIEESVLSSASFSIEGIFERVGVRIISGEERKKILKTRYRKEPAAPIILIQSKQRFPANFNVSLIWGQGITSKSGIRTESGQVFNFKTREPFSANFHCERENPQSGCLPITSMYLNFSAPVLWKQANQIALKGAGGKKWKAEKTKEGENEDIDEDKGDFVYGVVFKAPFPENEEVKIEMPAGIADDAGRKLINADKFPLSVRTGEFPPLAKFAAPFGIIELNANPVLPVTLRNIEPDVRAKMLRLGKRQGVIDKAKDIIEGLKGRIFKVAPEKLKNNENENEILLWLKKVEDAKRQMSILDANDEAKAFTIPKPNGAKAFEVVGIPLKEPGFYIVEIESAKLGAALLGIPEPRHAPVYVPTAVLVTNLSVHFKWGKESSIAWVTSLDKGEPVKDALVNVRDCKGKSLWQGKTNLNGIANIGKLPSITELSRCSYYSLDNGLFITAHSAKDMTFVHSSWNDGIEPWRFQIPSGTYEKSIISHTIFDRSLLRAGETIHMKHILRRHTMNGFSLVPSADMPKGVLIQHQGSGQRYEFPVNWDASGAAETTWSIPKEAKLGLYEVVLIKEKPGNKKHAAQQTWNSEEDYTYIDGWDSGQFRVEEFRVPLMKGIIKPPSEPMVMPSNVTLDLAVKYLAGGGAGNLPVKLRSHILPKHMSSFGGFEGFVFANGSVKEGLVKRGAYEEYEYEEGQVVEDRQGFKLKSLDLVLDKTGGARKIISDLPKIAKPMDMLTELEFKDPNGEVQTVSSKMPLWHAKYLVGIKLDSWVSSKDSLKIHAAVVNLSGKPVSNALVKVDIFERKTYSHRKRLVGGFYAYEHINEIKRIGAMCEGKTDKSGILICEAKSKVSGNIILQAKTADDSGNETFANRDVWVAGSGEWWFDVSDHDRIDILPEKKRYEPGETARFQVRMPFRDATALIAVEREGVIETFVKRLSGKMPVIDVPIKGSYAPNVFVSVLVVRGRVSGVQPTAMVDLGKPAYKLGIAEINVGWKVHELKVKVSPERNKYKVREKAKVKIQVRTADGKIPPSGSEVALAAVDEGLLELMPNKSWKLLNAMMGRRGYEVYTATAQMHVVGKRHFGLKALPQGGGGGKQTTRELFDTLLLWKGRASLDANGEAQIEIPLNDSITSFRIVAVATGGAGFFGAGSASIQSTQDLMLFSGISPLAREGDRFRAEFTLRNTTSRNMELNVSAKAAGLAEPLKPAAVLLYPGEAREIGWDITAPVGADSLIYEIEAKEKKVIIDRIKVKQKITPAVPVRTFQATIAQIEKDFSMAVEQPIDAVSGKGGINVLFRPTLLNGMTGVFEYMKTYPYTCLEQKISRAVALKDEKLWKEIMAVMPSYLDSDGLAKYFPIMIKGSDTLTAYLIAISHEAGWEMPKEIKETMASGLKKFVEGSIIRYSSLPTADLSIRKISAVEALSRLGMAEPKLLTSISIEANLWPTSSVIDWFNILQRVQNMPDRETRIKEAEQILRSRLNFQGTTMGFSTEDTDYLWWLMISGDVNAARLILSVLNYETWKEDIPRLVRGALARQKRGAWNLTVANAWGVLAMEKFSLAFEKTHVSGKTTAILSSEYQGVDWKSSPDGNAFIFAWPPKKDEVHINHAGAGKPWATVQSLAAIPLKEPFSSGYKIKKTLASVEQRQSGKWSRGDILRVRLDIEAQSDMTWVVVNDPIPAGASILGSGLGRDSVLAAMGEEQKGWVWPAFEERSFEAFRSYYEYVPKGSFIAEYTVRLNQDGIFQLPQTRVEALYSPEMFGEIPNEIMNIEP